MSQEDQKYEFIKGSDFYPSFYNENITKERCDDLEGINFDLGNEV